MATGLQIHLDASQIAPVADGTAVTTWADVSGNGRNADEVVGTAPTYQSTGLGGQPSLRFGGSGSIRSTFEPADDFSVANGSTVFFVGFSSSTGTAQRTLISIDGGSGNNQTFAYLNRFATGSLFASFDGSSGNNDSGDTLSGPYNNGNPFLFAFSGDPTGTPTVSQRANGGAQTLAYEESVDTGDIDDYTVASLNGGNSNLFVGDIAEILVYNRILSTAEIEQNEAFLLNKYAIPEPSVMALSLVGMLCLFRRNRV